MEISPSFMFQNDKSSFKTFRILFQVQKVPTAGFRRQYLSVIILGQRIASSLGSGSTLHNSTSKHPRLLNLKTKVEYFECSQPFCAATHVHMSLKEILSSFQVEHRANFAFTSRFRGRETFSFVSLDGSSFY